MNYVHDRSAASGDAQGVDDGKRHIVISTGGGDGGIEPIVDALVGGLAQRPAHSDWSIELILGPLAPPELEHRYREELLGLPVRIERFVPSPAERFQSADLVICTGGYNTTVEVLGFAQRAIIVPRVMHRQEQLLRARRLEELGFVRCLHPNELSAATLIREMEDMLDEPVGPLTSAREEGRLALDGAEQFAAFCSELRVHVRG